MRVLLVRNPVSGSASDSSSDEIGRALARLGPVTVLEPNSAQSLSDAVRDAARDADAVAVAGGDGTFGRVVDALAERLDELLFALLPAGTGNDLARTLRLPPDPVQVASALDPSAARPVDVGRIEAPGVRRLFVNACMAGFPVEVDEAIGDGAKRLLGPLAFWFAGIKAAMNLNRSTVRVDGREVRDCVAVGVGNGRSAGGGIEVWPEADPCDGFLDVCALGAPGAAGAARLAARVFRGTHGDLEGVYATRGSRIVIEAEPRIEFNVDGELVGATTPAVFERAGAIRMILPHGHAES